MLAEDYVGRVLKDIYRIDRLLGEGGPSVVFCGWDLLMEIPIAIKRLKKEATGRLIDPQRFLREARTQARLAHQNIVSIRAIIEDQDEYFIIMEYIEGRDLQSLIQRSQTTPRFSFPDALRIFEQVLSALGYAHKEGVIHRDIKPANILVADSLQVKLADFGLARAMEDKRLTEAGVVLGTPAYMAPEQVRSHKVDQRADIYAVGASIYESLSGATPFAHPNRPMSPFEMMRKQLYEDAPSLREKGLAIGDALDAVLRKSIAKDPEQRYASCEVLSEALSLAMKEDPLWSFVPSSPLSSPSSNTQLYASVSPEEAAKRDAAPVLSPVRKRIPLRPPMETAPPKDNDEVFHSAETVSPIEGISAYLSAQVNAQKAAPPASSSSVATAPSSSAAAGPSSSEQDRSPVNPANASAKADSLGEHRADTPSEVPASRPALLPTAIVPAQAKQNSESTGAKAPTPVTLPQIDPLSEASALPVGTSQTPSLVVGGDAAPTAFDLPLHGEASAHPAEMIAIPPEPTDPHVGPSPSSAHLLAPRSSAAALPIAIDDTPPLHHTRRPRKRRSSVPWGVVLLALLLIALGAGALGWGRIKSAWMRLSVQVQQKIEPHKKQPLDTTRAVTTYPQEKVPDMIMVEIPEGPFWRGFGSRNDVFSYAPRERITLRRYWIDRNEVSMRQYERCVKAGVCRRVRVEQEQPDLPITKVTWEEARRFCVWAGKRLPTEAEWEKAARGIDGRRFPWGEEALDCRRLNYRRCRLGLLSSVRAQQKDGKSPYKVYDMAGNVREWVADCYEKEAYRYLPLHDPIKEVAQCRERVVRGGSWLSSAREEWKLRTYARDNEPVRKRARDLGFRCAWSPAR